jgi:hypothetical protein
MPKAGRPEITAAMIEAAAFTLEEFIFNLDGLPTPLPMILAKVVAEKMLLAALASKSDDSGHIHPRPI